MLSRIKRFDLYSILSVSFNALLIDLCLFFFSDIRIKEEDPDPEEWQLSGDSTLNTNDLTHLRVQVVDEEGDQPHQEGKRLRRVACTCPNCKEGGGRYVKFSVISHV